MKVIESSPNKERLDLLKAVAADCAQYLEVDFKQESSKDIMAKIDATIVELVFNKSTSIPNGEEPDLLLGSLWGEMMIREFGWYWSDVKIDDQFTDVAIISPNQSMIIFPLSFVQACINKQCISTVALSFNMLLEDKGNERFLPKSYENIMLSIHHIVPPYVLDSSDKKW